MNPFKGTILADTIQGGHGADSFYGLAGNDILIGLAASDSIMGGDGDDYLSGGIGNDTLCGQKGDDYINAGPGIDLIHGGIGDDTLIAGAGTIKGGFGDDLILLQGVAESAVGVRVFTGGGHDMVDASDSAANNNIILGPGADTYFDGDGNDTIKASEKDTIDFNWLSAGGNNLVCGVDFASKTVVNLFNVENVHDEKSLNDAFDLYQDEGGAYDAFLVEGGEDVVFVYDDLRIRLDNLGHLIG